MISPRFWDKGQTSLWVKLISYYKAIFSIKGFDLLYLFRRSIYHPLLCATKVYYSLIIEKLIKKKTQ